MIELILIFTFWIPHSLQWRHNERDGVSNHQPQDCLLKRLFRRRSKVKSKLRVTGLCAGNSPVAGEFPAQRASNAEDVSMLYFICNKGVFKHSGVNDTSNSSVISTNTHKRSYCNFVHPEFCHLIGNRQFALISYPQIYTHIFVNACIYSNFKEVCTPFVFCYVFMCFDTLQFYPNSLGLRHWHWRNSAIVRLLVKRPMNYPWLVWVHWSHWIPF